VGGGRKGARGERKKRERGGEKEEKRKFSVLHMNELLNRSQSCERSSQTLKELGTVLRWCWAARGSVVRLSQPISYNMLNNFKTILRDVSNSV